jgi:DNA-binding NarL/FixJ family response regulator
MIRVVVIDDHPVVRAGMVGVFAAAPDIEVVGEGEDGDAALRLAGALRPEVMLMDLRMPRLDGASATAEIVRRYPEIKILIVTTYNTDADILRAVEAGAIGYLLKDTPVPQLLDAVRAAARGETVLAPTVAARLVRRARAPLASELTPRELEVLALV